MTKIQEYRMAKGLSKRALARKANVSDSTIRRLEDGKSHRYTTLRAFYNIAKALNVSIEDIIEPDLLD